MDGGGPPELGAFLRSRRARLRPEDVGLVAYGGRRRVPGLRREELAQLAGVSAAYYTRLEQGQSQNASEAVLDALARALRLTEDEHGHLRNLARPGRAKRRAPQRPETVRPATRHLISAMAGVPAVVLDRRFDVLDWNPLGHALTAGHLDYAAPRRVADRPNAQRMLFLDPHTRELHPQWDDEARRAVSSLRLAAGGAPDDRRLAELIGELTMKSPCFAALWSRHPVGNCTSGTKTFHHPVVGRFDLAFEMLRTGDGSGHRLLLYSAAPGTPDEAALRLLAAHAVTPGAAPAPGSAATPVRTAPGAAQPVMSA